MYPPFVTSLARIVPKGGAVIDGEFIPEGVRNNLYSRYRYSSVYLTSSDNRLMPPLRILSLRLKLHLSK